VPTADAVQPLQPVAHAAAAPSAVAQVLDFDTLYAQLFDSVWRNARRLGVPEAQVDDAVQEVFLIVHRRLPDFEGRSSLRTWVFGIVARVASEHRRTYRRKSPHARATGGVVEADDVAGETVGADDQLVRAEGVRLLHRLLDTLDDEKRTVLVLAELEQMTAPEIGEALGVNVNTVYARLRAARRDFEQAVARERARDERRPR
jgi:RNA polymerase sigma-70 factor (ECF subfamily)